MNSRLKESIIILLLVVAFIQIYFNNILTNKINEKPEYTFAVQPEYEDLAQLTKEMSILKNSIVLRAYKEDNIWHAELKMSGGKQEILDEMKKL